MNWLRDPVWQFVGTIVALASIVVPLLQKDNAWLIVGVIVAFIVTMLLIVSRKLPPIGINQSDRTFTQQSLDTGLTKQTNPPEIEIGVLVLVILLGSLGAIIGSFQGDDVRYILIGVIVGILFALMIWSMEKSTPRKR